MKKIVFTEEFCQPEQLSPFTLTRQIQDIRVGVQTIREKWEHYLDLESYDRNEDDFKDLDRSIDLSQAIGTDTIYLIHGNIIPTEKLVRQVKKLKAGECISVPGKESIVYCISGEEILEPNRIRITRSINFKGEFREIRLPWDIFQFNQWAIEQDVNWLSVNRKFSKISSSNRLMGEDRIFMERGAVMENCVVNATEGPVYIGKNATIMEGSLLRGPLSIGEGSTVKMGTRIYGATTIGPNCVVGGEIKNSVLFGNSNKAHDGYLGDSVIGEWCNLGAGTSNSNLKNNASTVSVWTPNGSMAVGLKCGVLMGDYSRTAINTSINTGTVVSVCCNIFGNGLTPKYVPPFSWGSDGVERYQFEKVLSDIENWKSLKAQTLTANEKIILKHIFDHY